MAVPYLQVENLTKSFGDKVLFESISFGVTEGQRVALVARNGAGKTTTIRNIMGFLKPDKGKITIYGMDSWTDSEKTKKYIVNQLYLHLNK